MKIFPVSGADLICKDTFCQFTSATWPRAIRTC